MAALESEKATEVDLEKGTGPDVEKATSSDFDEERAQDQVVGFIATPHMDYVNSFVCRKRKTTNLRRSNRLSARKAKEL